ncbi:F-box/kelch-repeat protein At3g06240-like [Silene latifolia]|uniref:F-box/kelch-repeat protein At3g06240-like n=1 Tax=Silene latifolia TaxID=37657 RepID=UPI003D76EC1A
MNRKKMKMGKASSNKYIPPEILTQILVNLPAKSLLKFRCVCKTWCSIIHNPDFVSIHHQFCKNNNSNLIKLLDLECLVPPRGYSGCLLALRKSDKRRKIGQIFKSNETYYLHGTCHSLLFVSPSKALFYGWFRLCNPSIRKSLRLPLCPLLSCSGYHYFTFVLGFAANTGDYKVIAISFESNLDVEIPKKRVMVYTLSDHQWAARDNGLDNIDCLRYEHLFGPYYFCEGAAHWLGKDPYEDTSNQDDKPTHLVSLDFDTESFTFLELPHALDEVDTISRSLFLLGESLATFCISSVSFKIWVLKQQSGKREWTLWFSGPSSSDGFDLFYYMGSTTNRVLYCESDGGRLVYKEYSYNITTCQVQVLGKSMSRYVEPVKYSESLVLCNRDGTEDMV